MKKFLAIFLTVCMMLSVTALAAETTYADPFTLFDFGSESRLEDMWKANLLSAWSATNAVIEENDDSWTLTVTTIPEYLDNNGNFSEFQVYSNVPQMVISSISNMTYGAFALNNGWGGLKPSGYKSSTDEWNYALDAQWVGKNQFMKIRLKNSTSNTIIGIFIQKNPGSATFTSNANFEISANDTEFQTYIVDMAKAQAVGGERGDYNKYASKSTGTWVGGTANTIRLYAFGAWAPNYYGLTEHNTYKNIELGATVEVDYMIFAATADMAAEYKSIDEGYVPAETTTQKVETTTTESVVETTTTESVVETTTTESVVETTTTESVVETTTTESVVETTTTESVVETTTTDAVVDETTTEAIVDQTTTPQDNGTTTTEQNTDDENDGGFPVWIIIVIVVVIGGVAAIFVFKKK